MKRKATVNAREEQNVDGRHEAVDLLTFLVVEANEVLHGHEEQRKVHQSKENTGQLLLVGNRVSNVVSDATLRDLVGELQRH